MFLNSRERDNELLKEALASAKKKYGKMKPKVNTRNPLYQKHFFENMRLAEHVRQHQVSIDKNLTN